MRVKFNFLVFLDSLVKVRLSFFVVGDKYVL